MKKLPVKFKEMFWKYKNESDPDIPSRSIKWIFKIPYIFKISGSIGWRCWSVDMRFLMFYVSFMVGYFTGDGFRLSTGIDKWISHLSIYFGPYKNSKILTFGVGISRIDLIFNF